MNMNRKELAKQLQAPPAPKPDETRLKQTFETAALILEQTRRGELAQRSSGWSFFLRQLHFIGWKVWLSHIALLLAALLLAVRVPPGAFADRWQLLAVLSTVSPLLALTGMRLLARSYACRMAELEMSTLYSLERLFLSRLCLFAIADVVGISGLAGCLSLAWGQQLSHLLLYLFTPFTVAAAGCLWLFNRPRIRDKGSACSFFTALLLTVQLAGAFRSPAGGGLNELLYGGGSAPGAWLCVLLLSGITAFAQLHRMLRGFRRAEGAKAL
ncbi:hypothetical protein [Paenibacillus tengchongensis]|uniref:hypothetical protein n=1 Tax=Paenibacillus tengchongensis TaxID=2608684 RepID=UPI00124DE78E|nr:hypothetical protein [Paenibacillus tengchongensis]